MRWLRYLLPILLFALLLISLGWGLGQRNRVDDSTPRSAARHYLLLLSSGDTEGMCKLLLPQVAEGLTGAPSAQCPRLLRLRGGSVRLDHLEGVQQQGRMARIRLAGFGDRDVLWLYRLPEGWRVVRPTMTLYRLAELAPPADPQSRPDLALERQQWQQARQRLIKPAAPRDRSDAGRTRPDR